MSPQDLLRFQTVAQRIVDAIKVVRGRVYTSQPGIGLYPTTGTHGDYAYARHIADPSLRKTYGYTFETGPFVGDVRESFHPADPTLIKRDAKSGMFALAQQCVCTIDLIGNKLLERDTEVSALRRVRDELLATTEAGREWIDLFERAQGRLVAVVLTDERLSADAATLLERAAALVEDESATVSDDDVERARSLMRRLSEESKDENVRADLDAVSAEVERMSGRTSREAIEGLTRRGPRGRGA
jgi:hypothetical protein